MQVVTSRFGPLSVDAEDMIEFKRPMAGLRPCRKWFVVADRENDAVAWLQSVECPDVALPVVSPRRFVHDYQARISRRELAALGLADIETAEILVIVAKRNAVATLNLKAPLLIDARHGLGGQVIAKGDLPVRHELEPDSAHFGSMRKSA